ncbi:MAG: hypothetical protein JKY20_06100 [Alphaproteobacteria bacterium]|nr:hypothetical protein [Alphaproteobacteria bacterium]
MKIWKSTLFTLLFVAGPLYISATQAQSRYESWRQKPDKLESIVQDLRALVDEADHARAADPRFLSDLRTLANKYSDPWPALLIQDSFRDGDFTRNPAWIVDSGFFETPYSGGLRSLTVEPARIATREEPAPRQDRPEDIAAILLGQILNQGRSREEPRRQATAPAEMPQNTRPGEIHLTAPVTNAFSLTINFRAEALSEAFGIGFFQTADRRTGYTLIHAAEHGFRLERRGARGAIDIATSPTVLTLKTAHELVWTRAADGAMIVTLDGATLFTITDRGFRDDWRGLTVTNTGGDITISTIKVKGAR